MFYVVFVPQGEGGLEMRTVFVATLKSWRFVKKGDADRGMVVVERGEG